MRYMKKITSFLIIFIMVVTMLPSVAFSESAGISMHMSYDDHLDLSGRTVEIVDAGEPTSWQNETVVVLEGETLVATGVGNAQVKIDDVLHDVTVEKAKLNLIVIMGQSNAGNHFENATSDITCPEGTAYWWGNGLGAAAAEPVPYTQSSQGFHTPLLAELYAQSSAAGDPVKNVLIWHEGVTSKNGKSITAWADSSSNTQGTDNTVTMIEKCRSYYESHSDKYEIVGNGVYWLQGESDTAMDPELYKQCFYAMWERLESAGMEYMAFLRVRRGVYENGPEHQDLYYSASLSAQIDMINSNPDFYMATTLTENWTGTEDTIHTVDISDYITMSQIYSSKEAHTDQYGNDATFKDGQLTTSMKCLYGSNNKCHYGKFGYGAIGADAAYNMYNALNNKKVSFVCADTSGQAGENHQKVLISDEAAEIDITHMNDDLSFRAMCGSVGGTLSLSIKSNGEDITQKSGVIINTGNHYGAISVEALKEYENVSVDITYNTIGGEVYEASGKIIKDAHEFGDWQQVTAPTCGAEGLDKRVCSECGAEEFRDTRISGNKDQVLVSNKLPEDYYEDKTIMCVGDSITAGTGVDNEQKYYYELSELLGAETLNRGTSGATLSPDGHLPNKFETVMTESYLKNVDVVTVLLGVNDWNNGVKDGYFRDDLKYDPSATYYNLGELGTDDTSTIYGAAKMWCERMVELKETETLKDIEFVFMTPVILCRNRSVTMDDDWSAEKENVFGYTLRQYCNAIMETAAMYDIPVLDLNMYSGMYYHSEEDNNVDYFGGDGIHPGANGHKMMADALAEFLLDNYSYEDRAVANCGHSYKEIVMDPTCLEDGYTTFKCSVCYYSYDQAGDTATGHKPGEDATCMTPQLCTVCDVELTPALGHDLIQHEAKAAGCETIGWSAYETCSRCDYTTYVEIPATGHSAGPAADCTTAQKCETCGEILNEPVGHNYEPAVTAPTCTAGGFTTYTCTACGDSYIADEVAALGHTEEVLEAVPPTCTETGLTAGAECTVCHKITQEQEIVTALGHKPGEPATCVADQLCTTCGETLVTAFGHTPGKEATCVTSQTCTVCDEELAPALGHSWQAATCTEPKTCTTCDATEGEALGHTYTKGTCTACGHSVLGSDWITPDFAEGDYSMVVIPDMQYLVQFDTEVYYNLCRWIADNKETYNIQAAMHMGDMVEVNFDRQWERAKAGMDIIDKSGISWMPMRGNHDASDKFNEYFPYEKYGNGKTYFGGSYHENRLDHTYWFVSAGAREYMVFSLGWEVTSDVLDWAEEAVKQHPEKNIIVTAHAYVNNDGTLLESSGFEEEVYVTGSDIWERFSEYDNVVLGLGGHVNSADLVYHKGQNGAGRDVVNVLVNAQREDELDSRAMLALLTFHEDSDKVDVNWYSTRFDAMFRANNQFEIVVPHVTESENPGEPDMPVEPSEPVEPEEPAGPEIPDEPESPSEPSEPEQPNEPETPEVVVQLKIAATVSQKTETITLKWNDAAQEKYEIYRSRTGKAGSFGRIGETTSAKYEDKTAKPGITYYYKVRGCTDGMRTEFSNVVTAKIKKATVAYVKASKMTIRSYYAGRGIKVTWTSPRVKVDGYEIWRSNKLNGTYKKIKTTNGSVRQWTNTGLKFQTRWYYKVRGYKMVDGKKVYTKFSTKGYRYVLNARNAKLANAIDKANAITSAKVVKVKGGIKVTWSKKDTVKCNRYEVWRSTSKNGKYTRIAATKQMSYKDTKNLKAGKRYYYKIVGYRWFGKACPKTKASGVVSAVR